MSKYKVVITQKAKNNIKDIVQYISNQLSNESAALNLARLFKIKMSNLDLFPCSNPLVEESPWREQGIRKIMIKMFAAYYLTNDSNKTVTVLWAAYAKRNQIEELKKLDNYNS